MTPGKIAGTRLPNVLEDFAISTEPLETRLDDFTARYPQYESALRALAENLTHLENAPPTTALSAEGERLTLHGLQCLEAALASPGDQSTTPRDVFEGKSPKELRLLAQSWSLPVAFLAKLRDRLIVPSSIPSSFIAWLASASGDRQIDLAHSFSLPPRLSASLQFKSEGKPATQLQQSFQEAIDSSSMPEEDKQKLRAFLD